MSFLTESGGALPGFIFCYSWLGISSSWETGPPAADTSCGDAGSPACLCLAWLSLQGQILSSWEGVTCGKALQPSGPGRGPEPGRQGHNSCRPCQVPWCCLVLGPIGGSRRKSCPACPLLEVVAEARPGAGPLQGRGGTKEPRDREHMPVSTWKPSPGKRKVSHLLGGESACPVYRRALPMGFGGPRACAVSR